MKKNILLGLLLAFALVLTACGGNDAGRPEEGVDENVSTVAPAQDEDGQPVEDDVDEATNTEGKLVRIGVSPAPHAQIAEKAKEVLADEGIELEIIEFDDYVIPNTALAEGDLEMNFFQHDPYLDNFNKERGTDLSSLGGVHIEPMGIYSTKYNSLEELPEGAEIIIPNDATNGARGLIILENAGLIKLDPEAGIEATENDITENPKNFKFVPVEAASVPRTYVDADAGVINSNYAIEAGLSPTEDAFAIEETEGNPYANVLAVRTEDKDDETLNKVKEAFQSDEVISFIEEEFKGEILPAK